MSDWITDRRPTEKDADCTGFVWITTEYGVVLREPWKTVRDRPWMPITPPEPYVKTNRWRVVDSQKIGFAVYDGTKVMKVVAINLPTREAAERIAAIYEEVMP